MQKESNNSDLLLPDPGNDDMGFHKACSFLRSTAFDGTGLLEGVAVPSAFLTKEV